MHAREGKAVEVLVTWFLKVVLSILSPEIMFTFSFTESSMTREMAAFWVGNTGVYISGLKREDNNAKLGKYLSICCVRLRWRGK